MPDNVWVAAGEEGLISPAGDAFRRDVLPDASILAIGGGQLFCACRQREEVLIVQKGQWLPSAPGLSAMSASPDGRFLYQLSGDCDSLTCVDVNKAQPLYLMKCGCYPQGLHMNPIRPLIAVAAGATGEIQVLQTPDLRPTAVFRVPGVASCVTFTPYGIVFLSAVEKGEICTLLGCVRHGNRGAEEIAVFPGVPGALCALNDGTVLLSVAGILMRVRVYPYKIMFSRMTDGLVTGIVCDQDRVLICDSAAGRVLTFTMTPPFSQRVCYDGTPLHTLFGPRV